MGRGIVAQSDAETIQTRAMTRRLHVRDTEAPWPGGSPTFPKVGRSIHIIPVIGGLEIRNIRPGWRRCPESLGGARGPPFSEKLCLSGALILALKRRWD
jgi:hypothetical protein